MKAPRIPSLFRNVKTSHRRFEFRSPYFDPRERELEERKRRIEEEVAREKGESPANPPRKISIGKRRADVTRRQSLMAMARTLIILIILVYLLYKGLQWAEGTDFGKVLNTLQNG